MAAELNVTEPLEVGLYDVLPKGTQPPPTGDCECDVKIGTVTTLPAGTPATANMRKVDKTHYLDLGLTKGDQGIPGPPGSGSGGGGGISLGRGYVSVMDYGAKGDGSADDAPAFTAAWNAVRGTGGEVYIPVPNAFYRFNSTFHAKPAGNQAWVDLKMCGMMLYNGIRYFGPSNAPIISSVGLKMARWESLRMVVENGRTGVQAIDFHTEGGANSETGVNVCNAYILLGDGANNTAFQFDKIQGGNGDISLFNFDNCCIYGTRKPGQYAYQSQGPNVLAMNVYGGFVAQCDSIFSNLSSTGQDSDRGGSCWYFYGVHTSGNMCCYQVDREGTFIISGGRYEHDDMMLRTAVGNSNVAITFDTVRADGMQGQTMFDMKKSFALKLNNCHFGPKFTDLVVINNDQLSTLIIEGGASRATNLYRRASGVAGKCKVYVRGHGKWVDDGTSRYIDSYYPDVAAEVRLQEFYDELGQRQFRLNKEDFVI